MKMTGCIDLFGTFANQRRGWWCYSGLLNEDQEFQEGHVILYPSLSLVSQGNKVYGWNVTMMNEKKEVSKTYALLFTFILQARQQALIAHCFWSLFIRIVQ